MAYGYRRRGYTGGKYSFRGRYRNRSTRGWMKKRTFYKRRTYRMGGFPINYGAMGGGTEKKYFDTPGNDGNAYLNKMELTNTVGALKLLFNPQPGTGYDQRIGRQVKATSLYFKFRCALKQAELLTPDTYVGTKQCRLMIIYDRQPNGVEPSVGDIIEPAAALDPLSQLNADNRDRFQVIWSKNYVFDPITVGSDPDNPNYAFNRTCYNADKYKKLNHTVTFNGAGGPDVDAISTGAFYFVGFANSGGTANRVNIEFTCRFRYSDS